MKTRTINSRAVWTALGGIASIIAIITFTTGRQSIYDFFTGNSSRRTVSPNRSAEQSSQLVALIESCRYNEGKCTVGRVSAFLRAGASPDARNVSGLPVLSLAIGSVLHPTVVRTIIEFGADVNAPDTRGSTPLHVVMGVNNSLEARQYLRLLLSAGANVNATADDGWTALMLAAHHGHDEEIVAALLEAGASCLPVNPSGQTALDIAEERMKESFPGTTRHGKIAELIQQAEDEQRRRWSGLPNAELKLPFIRQDVCPGEGCVYGQWVADRLTVVYGTEGDRATATVTIQPDEVFTAVRGNVHVTRPGIVRVMGDIHCPPNTNRRLFRSGDLVLVLTYYGEGFFDVWYQGQIFQIGQFWEPLGSPYASGAKGVLSVVPEQEHWVLVETTYGESGWIVS